MRTNRCVLSAAIAATLIVSTAACGGSDGSASGDSELDLGTVPLGELPELDDDNDESDSTTNTAPTTEQMPDSLNVGASEELSNFVDGNRVLLVGDSVLAATSPVFGGPVCDLLPEGGWEVQLAVAEGKQVEFGHRVFDALLADEAALTSDPDQASVSSTPDTTVKSAAAIDDSDDAAGNKPPRPTDFDVIGIFFGNNFDGDVDKFQRQYEGLLDRAGDRPVILYTPTAVDDEISEAAEVIRQMAADHDNARLVDWDELSTADSDELLADDGVHLTQAGAGRVIASTLTELGQTAQTGGCFDEILTEQDLAKVSST